jgi:hypothetical protein
MRVRFTIRGALVAVALVAFAASGARWAVWMRHRSREHQVSADIHEIQREYAKIRSRSPARSEGERQAAKKSMEWHAKRRDLYQGAASRPWRDVAPESEPKGD